MATVHEDQYTFLIISPSILLRIKDFQKILQGKLKYILCSVTVVSRKSCRLWDNVEKYCTANRPQMTICHMRVAAWIPKFTYTHNM